MQSENRLLEDLAKIAGGAFSSFSTLRDEAEARLHEKLEKILVRMDLVKRDEFEAVQAIAINARTQNAELIKQFEELKTRVEGELARKNSTTRDGPNRRKQRTTLEGDPSPEDS